MELEKFIRKNILDMEAYSAARDLIMGDDYVFLDANENPFGNFNRYPDPLQKKPKALLAKIKGVEVDNMVMGNGSDEILDLLFRVACTPEKDEVLSIDPSYGMYYTLACLNNVKFNSVLLDEGYKLNPDKILSKVNPNTKMIILCNPNNPTGNAFEREKLIKIVKSFEGIVVVDEAYMDFANQESMISQIKENDNLVVIQTFSKAWGLAGLRCGVGYMSKALAQILNKVKMPYNMNGYSQQILVEKLSDLPKFEALKQEILSQREMLLKELPKFDYVEKVYPTDANFILIKLDKHKELQNYLLEGGIIVRSRHSMPMCQNCIRITVGSKEENQKLLELMRNFK